MSDNELGEFLRTAREAVTPAEVGLPTGPRRRTPGLRRAELATLAGVSIDYLSRLEQGRDRHPSPQVLGALADAMRLSPEARGQLRLILTRHKDRTLCEASRPPVREVRPPVRAILDRLEPTPAHVVNRIGEVIAWTDGFDRLARPAGLLDGEPPNLARFVFTDRRARAVFPDWDAVADRQIANLRVETHRDDPQLALLTEELSVAAGAAFTERLTARIPLRGTGVDRFAHPVVGELRLTYETLALPDADEQRLVVQLPADEATAAAVNELDGRRPGSLRAVR
ncbi:helix-turn-helix domain-containing protein [Amycolatopsis thermophila]|uniref:Transcriptional regulator with XRE-family HTH domain n=1 Tax=Amycolatopsis thermophila TaxID=206084 RepID=A0ABU0EU23_9PSEU|nr:helix-turn-helix transcriptional regulator [Amycolatopsis thermophila]MDQ0378810.1 transcriptional regulator with XRE-family HTH domain [Amycolatopsis thermophila]